MSVQGEDSERRQSDGSKDISEEVICKSQMNTETFKQNTPQVLVKPMPPLVAAPVELYNLGLESEKSFQPQTNMQCCELFKQRVLPLMITLHKDIEQRRLKHQNNKMSLEQIKLQRNQTSDHVPSSFSMPTDCDNIVEQAEKKITYLDSFMEHHVLQAIEILFERQKIKLAQFDDEPYKLVNEKIPNNFTHSTVQNMEEFALNKDSYEVKIDKI